MDNILPTFKTFALDNKYEDHPSQWKPSLAVAKHTDEVRVAPSKEAKRSYSYDKDILPPNQRHHKEVYSSDSSPLCVAERGTSQAPEMSLANTVRDSGKMRKQSTKSQKNGLVVKFYNGCTTAVHLYYQGPSSVSEQRMLPNSCDTRTVQGVAVNIREGDPTLEMLMSTSRRLSVVMSLKQELKLFNFHPGSIGIEVELKSNKLFCSRVFEGTQASFYSNALTGAEIISVNGTRVITIAEFERALIAAQECAKSGQEFIVIQAAAYRGARLTIDEIIKFNQKSRKMSKIFSNVFNEADDEHQHDVSLPSKIDEPLLEEDSETATASVNPNSNIESKQPEIVDTDPGLDSKMPDLGFDQQIIEGFDSQASSSIDDEGITLVADPRRHTAIVHDSVEFFSAIGSGQDPPPKVVEEVVPVQTTEADKSEDGDAGSLASSNVDCPQDSSKPAWEYATALDEEDITSHRVLVCLPEELMSSRGGWGSPSHSHSMHFANFSEMWKLDIYWIGEDSALVSRATLRQGETHFELMSSSHVWCVTASRVYEESSSLKKETDFPETFHAVDDRGNYEEDVKDVSAVSIVFRPPVVDKVTPYSSSLSAIWIPWSSLSFASCSSQSYEVTNDDAIENIGLFFKLFDNTSLRNNRNASRKSTRRRK